MENDWNYLGNSGTDLLLAHQQWRAAPAHRRDRHRAGPARDPRDRAAGRGDARRRLDRRPPADRRISGRREERGPHLHASTAAGSARSPCPASAAPAASAATRRSSETFYSFASFNRPATIYRYDSATGADERLRPAAAPFRSRRVRRPPGLLPLARRHPHPDVPGPPARARRHAARSRPCSTAMAASTSARRRPSSRAG